MLRTKANPTAFSTCCFLMPFSVPLGIVVLDFNLTFLTLSRGPCKCKGPLQTVRGPDAAWRARQDGCHVEMCSPARMQNCNPRNVTDVIDIASAFANLILWHLMVKSCFCFSRVSFIENTSQIQKFHFFPPHHRHQLSASELHEALTAEYTACTQVSTWHRLWPWRPWLV